MGAPTFEGIAKAQATILIDKDGVLNYFGGWKGHYQEYPMRKGVKGFLQSLKKSGYRLVLFTASPIPSTKQWLEENGIAEYFDHVTDVKEPATVYIDDRAVCFSGDFQTTLQEVMHFRPFWDKTGENDGWIHSEGEKK